MAAQLKSYSTIWPPQLCMLKMGNPKLVVCISRVASVARFAEHSSQPSCELRAYRVNGEARLLVISSQGLLSGDPVTIDYTSFSMGGRESHRQADWILRIREMRRLHTRSLSSSDDHARPRKRAAAAASGSEPPAKARNATTSHAYQDTQVSSLRAAPW